MKLIQKLRWLAPGCILIAQVAYAQTVSVKVPFAFHAGASQFPAGEYTVDTQAGKVPILVRSADRRQGAFVSSIAAISTASRTKASLVFNRYGDEYFLAAVWDGASGTGRKIPPNHAEKLLSRKATDRSEEVLLAMLPPTAH